jgi:hypothetical protein
MRLFDFTVDGYEIDDEWREEHLVDLVNGMVWCEMEVTEQNKPTHSHRLLSHAGVGVWYDYGADYYYFEDEEEE